MVVCRCRVFVDGQDFGYVIVVIVCRVQYCNEASDVVCVVDVHAYIWGYVFLRRVLGHVHDVPFVRAVIVAYGERGVVFGQRFCNDAWALVVKHVFGFLPIFSASPWLGGR